MTTFSELVAAARLARINRVVQPRVKPAVGEPSPPYKPLLVCAGSCGKGVKGLGTRHEFVRREFSMDDVARQVREVWVCCVCKEERRWG